MFNIATDNAPKNEIKNIVRTKTRPTDGEILHFRSGLPASLNKFWFFFYLSLIKMPFQEKKKFKEKLNPGTCGRVYLRDSHQPCGSRMRTKLLNLQIIHLVKTSKNIWLKSRSNRTIPTNVPVRNNVRKQQHCIYQSTAQYILLKIFFLFVSDFKSQFFSDETFADLCSPTEWPSIH